jgi:hypothetical protein
MNSTQYLEALIAESRNAFGAGVQTHHLNHLKALIEQEKAQPVAPAPSARNEYR